MGVPSAMAQRRLQVVDGERKELVPAQFARHDVNADNVHPERLGRFDQAARTFQLLLQPLVKAVGHHKGGDAAAAGGEVVLERLNAVGGGQRCICAAD